MLKGNKERSERSRTKAEFRLQFKATQVPNDGWDKLCVNLVPQETGKITAKTEKVTINNGVCQWAEPIIETVRLEKDAKARQYNPQLYNLVVSTGSSWYGFLGENTVDLTEYVGSQNPIRVDLPLKRCMAGTILHVTIQQIKDASTSRVHLERDRNQRVDWLEGLNSKNPQASEDAFDHGNEGRLLSTLKEQLRSGSSDHSPGHVKSHGHHRPHSIVDVSYPSSGSSPSDKQERSSVSETSFTKKEIPSDPLSFLSAISQSAKLSKSGNESEQSMVNARQQETRTDGRPQNRNSSQSRENIIRESEKLKAKLKASEVTIKELRIEVEELQGEVSSLERREARRTVEMETLKRQLSKEIQQGKDLACEISALTAERDDIKVELQQLKASKVKSEKSTMDKRPQDMDNSKQLLEELKQELEYEKQKNIDINMQLQKTQEANSELLLAINDLETMLQEKDEKLKKTCRNSTDVLASDQDENGKALDAIDMQWMESLSSSEKMLTKLLQKINLDNSMQSLKSILNDDLNSLEISFYHAKQDMESTVFELKKDLNSKTDLITRLESDLHRFTRKMNSSKGQQDDLNNQEQSPEFHNISDKGNVELNYSHTSSLQEAVSQIEADWAKILKRNQKLQEEIARYKLDVKELERQLIMVDEEAQALAEVNQQLEAKVESLELENIDIQNHFNESQEACKVAHEQIKKLVEEIAGLKEELKDNKEQDLSTQGSNESFSKLEARIIEVSEEAEDYKKARDGLVKELEQLEKEYEVLRQEHAQCSTQTENLNTELQSLKDQNATSFSRISILESKIEDLQHELNSKAVKFAEDFDALLQSKKEQDQKLKLAEETLRKTRWDNASAIERIQENFKKVSQQMSITFQAKEKLANEALQEASDLRLEKATLQESLRNAEDEIASINNQHHEKVQELTMQLGSLKKENESLSVDLKGTLAELEKQKKEVFHESSRIKELLSMIDGLQADREFHMGEKAKLSEKVQHYEQMKSELEETKRDLDHCMAQKLEIAAALRRVEQGKLKSEEEVCLLKENLRNLDSEIINLKSSAGSISPKRKEIIELQHTVKRLEDEIMLKSKALEDARQETRKKEEDRKIQAKELEAMRHQITQENYNRKKVEDELQSLKEHNAQLLEHEKELLSNLRSQDSLSKEIQKLKMANEELHSKIFKLIDPAKYEQATNKIRGLENELAEALKDHNMQKRQLQSVLEQLEEEANQSKAEIEKLKRQNSSIDEELKDMRERYTSVSLKFAEVEGERQMLVMTIKGLKAANSNR